MLPYKVLHTYVPLSWRPQIIGYELLNISTFYHYDSLPLGKHRLHKGVWKSEAHHADLMRRTPGRKTADIAWHQDGDITGADMDCGLILWASRTPTEFLVAGKIYQPNPFEVVYFNNLDGMHRRPADAPRKRWTFRQRVHGL